MSDALNPVRFVPVDTGPKYPRQRLLADVPIRHMVRLSERHAAFVVMRAVGPLRWLVHVNGWTEMCETTVGRLSTETVFDHGPVEKIAPNVNGGWDFILESQPVVPATVLLGSLAPLDVVRFPDHQIGVLLHRVATCDLFVKVGDAYRDSDRNTLVTLLGSIRFGGVA